MKTGDIILIPFPFSELTQLKLRPAVVIPITKDKYRDLVLSAVSSQVIEPLTENEIFVKPDSLNGLRVNSVIKVDRIFTLKVEKAVAQIGNLSSKDLAKFKEVFRSLVD
jgi:mRNA interferase MazF